MQFVLAVLFFLSHAGGAGPETSMEGKLAQCLAEVDNSKGDPKLKDYVRENFAPAPKIEDMGDFLLKKFPNVVSKNADGSFGLKGTDVGIHFNDAYQKAACSLGGGLGYYTTFQGKKSIVICHTGPTESSMTDVFHHEATHALQFNSANGVVGQDPLLKFIMPDGQEKAADHLSQYTMPNDWARREDERNAQLNKSTEDAAKKLTGNATDIKYYLNPAGEGLASVLGTLQALGAVQTTSSHPLKLKWSPYFQSEGGEAKFKQGLVDELNRRKQCLDNDAQNAAICKFAEFKSNTCPTANDAGSVYKCFGIFANRGLLAIENIANANPQNLAAVSSMIDTANQSACFGVVSFCTESQAYGMNGVGRFVRGLDGQALGLSPMCQRGAFNSNYVSDQGAAAYNRTVGPELNTYNTQGWGAVQDMLVQNDKEMLNTQYGRWAYSGLSGFNNLNPSMCKSSPDANTCLWRGDKSSTGDIAPDAGSLNQVQ